MNAPGGGFVIPKRAFPTPEAQQQFADFLARTIVPPTMAFPVLPLPAIPPAPGAQPIVNDSR